MHKAGGNGLLTHIRATAYKLEDALPKLEKVRHRLIESEYAEIYLILTEARQKLDGLDKKYYNKIGANSKSPEYMQLYLKKWRADNPDYMSKYHKKRRESERLGKGRDNA